VKNNKKKTTGIIHGVFDVIHVGHINYFKEAKSKVDKLIVSVTSDRYVNKGPGKPIFNLKKRIDVLSSIKYIDKIIESDYPTAIQNIRKIKPDLYIKGKDYKNLDKDVGKNLLLEKKEVEKYGGKILFTNSELHSSSALANNVFNYLNEDIKKILEKLDKNNFIEKFNLLLKNKINKKILVIGEPILDIIRFVKPSGKSNKNNIIATQFIFEEITAGGTLLPLKLLNLFCNDVSLLVPIKKQNVKIIKNHINKKVNLKIINSENNLIKKIRYVDEYNLAPLFQSNKNEKDTLTKLEIEKISNFLKKKQNQYDHIIFFNYGYLYENKKFKKILNKVSNKLIINIQSNSYNFGYNLADQFSKGDIISMDESEFRLLVKNKNKELKILIKENLNIFKKFKILIITQGKLGAFIIFKGKINFIPSIFKPKIDSTGSGDIFLTTFAACKIFKKFSIIETSILSHLCAGLHANTLGNRFNLNAPILKKTLDSILK